MKSQAKAYIAPHEVYTGGALYPAGAVFVTDAPEGRAWRAASEAEQAAAELERQERKRRGDMRG